MFRCYLEPSRGSYSYSNIAACLLASPWHKVINCSHLKLGLVSVEVSNEELHFESIQLKKIPTHTQH